MKTWIKWLVAVIIIAIVGYWIIAASLKGVPVRVAAAETGTVLEYVEDRAKTSLPKIHRLTMPLDGRIAPITLTEGTPVKKGQVVAEMVTADLETRLAEAKAQMEAIKGQIKINEYHALEDTALKESKDWIGTMVELVKAASKKIESSKAVYKYASEYERSMAESGQAVSKIKLSQAQMQAAVAQVDTETAEIMFNAMKMIQSVFNLAPTYINEFLNRKNLTKEVLTSQLSEAQAILTKAERDLNRAKITSPVDGVILTRHVSNERVLPAGAPLLDIGDMNALRVTADILSQDAVRIAVGNSTSIFGPAIGLAPVKGKVVKVKPQGFTKISSLGVDQQRVPVIVDFDPEAIKTLKANGRTLGNGYRVQVKIQTASAENARRIPRTALFKGESGDWQVFAVKNGKAALTNVKVGLVNDRRAQITNGLAPDDLVIVSPPVSLKTGDRLSYAKPK